MADSISGIDSILQPADLRPAPASNEIHECEAAARGAPPLRNRSEPPVLTD